MGLIFLGLLAFEYVKSEVIENEQDIMDCMLSIYADDMQTQSRYTLLEFDFRTESEWENEEEETSICNIVTVHIPFNLTQIGKEAYADLFELLTDKKPEWLKNEDVEVNWSEAYQSEKGKVYPLQIFLRNASPEMASRFISFMAAYFLPEGNDMEIWTEFMQEFDAGYEPVCDFYPEDGETITVTKEACPQELIIGGNIDITFYKKIRYL